MTHARADDHAHSCAHVERVIVEFKLRSRLALEKVVRLGQPFVVVLAGVDGNLHLVDRAGKVIHFGQRAASLSAGARRARQRGKIDNFPARSGDRFRHGSTWFLYSDSSSRARIVSGARWPNSVATTRSKSGRRHAAFDSLP